jgi:probable F420-dependent oxidoreductase
VNVAKLGAWVLINEFAAPEAAGLAQRLEDLGYGHLWIPEAFGRDPMIGASWLLANTTRLQVATGIANTYARDPMAMVNAQYGLNEQSGGRFLLGIGVSHSMLVEGVRGHEYRPPLAEMKTYLVAMAKVQYSGVQPAEKPLTVIAALGPKMLEVARDMADGAHPYNVTPGHTAKAREILGPGKLLMVEQKCVLETDPARARAIGRRVIGHSINLPNYRNSFLRMGFTTDDLENGGSDRLIDGLLAWGDESAIRARIQEHWDAGADQVCIQVVAKEGMRLNDDDLKLFELLAPAKG